MNQILKNTWCEKFRDAVLNVVIKTAVTVVAVGL
jgi:hypothetical protein